MKNILILLIAVISTTSTIISQENKIEKATKDFDKFAYVDTREILLKVVDKGYHSQDIYEKLGDSYYFNADLPSASKWYGLLYDSYGDEIDSEYLFRYAQSLKSLGQYAAADRVMEDLYSVNSSDDRAVFFQSEKNYLDLIEMQSGRFELSDVGINSELSDFAPSFYQGNLVYASNRSNRGITKRIHEWNDQPFLDLYVTGAANESGGKSDRLSKALNSRYHESTAAFTKDGNTVYFTRNNYTKRNYQEDSNGTNLLKMYRSVKVDGQWEVAKELPFNSNEYSVAHPALSPDEGTLYFASDMPGGEGLSDLYQIEIMGDSFGTPVSLGDVINTAGRETFPFIAKNGDMYFSSDGHQGLGGLDVFVVERQEGGTYGEGYNIGEPVNSSMDDFTFIINSTSGIGYFASNREGGKGSDDIYTFRQIEAPIKNCIQTLRGTVRDKDTNEVISDARVVLYDENNNILRETISAVDGKFNLGQVSCTTRYSVRATKETYDPDEKSFITSDEFSANLQLALGLDPQPEIAVGADLNKLLDLNPIYFDLDKSFIRADAEIELQKVIAFMKQYPTYKIDVRSHTDSRNTHAYNIKLSQRRNVSTLAYIIEKGSVSASRLTGRGYGENQLINACADGIECSEEMHQLNRRSEFIIIEK
ncbi:MAG: OmpA family protein [Flavobacteriaceae bacterium]|nr:OmpA family protein [Flavobacteriaceae bacterium]